MCAPCSDRAIKLLKLLGDFRATAELSTDAALARRLNDTADELLDIVRDMRSGRRRDRCRLGGRRRADSCGAGALMASDVASYLRQQAAELRRRAAVETDLVLKDKLSALADDCERLANSMSGNGHARGGPH